MVAIRPAQREAQAEVEAISLANYLATGIGNHEGEARTASLLLITPTSSTLSSLLHSASMPLQVSIAPWYAVATEISTLHYHQFNGYRAPVSVAMWRM